MELKQLQEKHRDLLAKSEAIRSKYNGVKDANMTPEEEQEWSNILDEADTVARRIDLLQRESAAQKWAGEVANRLPVVGATGKDLAGGALGNRDAILRGEGDAGRAAFAKFLKSGIMAMREDDLKALAQSTSTKAYQADDPAGGGFLVAPQQFVTDVITLMKDLVFVRQFATTHSLARAESLGVPVLDPDPDEAEWTAELRTGSEEGTMKFGKRELRPHPLAKRLKLSNKLVRQSAINVESLVEDRIGYKFSVSEEKGFLVGDGANKPLGMFTPSDSGIPTSRDVNAANANTVVADDFIEVKYSLKTQYLAKARWILSRNVVKATRKLKDTTGNYLWTAGGGATGPGGGLQATPERLLDLPIIQSEYAPGDISTGKYTALLGDLSYYWIADALDWQMQVLDQLYAETNQTGYICRKETDGMPVLAEAFARLKQA